MEVADRLMAIEQIRQLKARYFRCVDSKEWDALAGIFTDDVVFDRTYAHSVRDPWSGEWSPPLAAEPQLVRGREAVMAMIRSAVAEMATVHHGHMPEIDVTTPDSATAIWAMSDELRDRRVG